MARDELRPVITLRSMAGTAVGSVRRENRRDDPDGPVPRRYVEAARRPVESREQW